MSHFLHTLQKIQRKKKRIGRGNGSRGSYSGRGMKGQKARAGSGKFSPGFEGGQTPFHARMPKIRGKGFRRKNISQITVSSGKITKFSADGKVTLKKLRKKGLIKKYHRSVKIVGKKSEAFKNLKFDEKIHCSKGKAEGGM